METIETLKQKLQRAEQHRPAEAKYPTDLMIDIRGPQGNVFYLFGIADKLTRQLALSDEEINEFKQERDLISQRTKEALAVRRASGQKLGREKGSKNKSHKLDGQAETIKKMLKNKIPKTKIAKKLKVSVSTVYKHLSKKKNEKVIGG
jgi:hypothetical protein